MWYKLLLTIDILKKKLLKFSLEIKYSRAMNDLKKKKKTKCLVTDKFIIFWDDWKDVKIVCEIDVENMQLKIRNYNNIK